MRASHHQEQRARYLFGRELCFRRQRRPAARVCGGAASAREQGPDESLGQGWATAGVDGSRAGDVTERRQSTR